MSENEQKKPHEVSDAFVTGVENRSMPQPPAPKNGVSYRAIALFAASFIAGGLGVAIVWASWSGSVVPLSPLGLINFTFSIALSAASIVLAIAAISLSKSSEQIMVQRSDESIRLQLEVYKKTTDALTKLQSSSETAGRTLDSLVEQVGEISKTAVERGLPEGTSDRDRDRIVADIQEKLQHAIRPGELWRMEAPARVPVPPPATPVLSPWERNRQELSKALENPPPGWSIIRNEETGGWTGEPHELAAIVLAKGDKRIGLSTHGADANAMRRNGEKMAGKLPLILAALAQGYYSQYVLSFLSDFDPSSHYGKLLAGASSVSRPEIFARLIVVKGDAHVTAAKVRELCSKVA